MGRGAAGWPTRLSAVLILALAVFAAGPKVVAQSEFIIEHNGELSVRGFHGAGSARAIRRSFQSDSEARTELDRILRAVGLNWIGDRILLRASAETANAEAGISRKGERFIFYNATFMQKLKERTAEQWALVSVLAHELGHHVAFHTEENGNLHKYELEADYFSGFVLRRLGASLDQAHSALKQVSTADETETHPALPQRLQAITIGWTDGGNQGTPRGLHGRSPEQLTPQPTPANSEKVVRDVQAALVAQKCLDAVPDGVWGTASRKALQRFQRRTNSKVTDDDPGADVLAIINAYNGLACECGANERRVDGECIAKPREVISPPPVKSRPSSSRPDASSYSYTIWAGGSVPTGTTVRKATPYGTLVCRGSYPGGPNRSCYWD